MNVYRNSPALVVPRTAVIVVCVTACGGALASLSPALAIGIIGAVAALLAVIVLVRVTGHVQATLLGCYAASLPFPIRLPGVGSLEITVQGAVLYALLLAIVSQRVLYLSHTDERKNLDLRRCAPLLLAFLAFALLCSIALFQYVSSSAGALLGQIQLAAGPLGLDILSSSAKTVNVGFFTSGPLYYGLYRLHFDALDPLVTVVVALLIVDTTDKALFIARGLLTGAILVALYLMYLQFTGAPVNPAYIDVSGRLGSQLTSFSGYHPNSFSPYFGFMILLALVLLSLKKSRLLALVSLAIFVPALWLTYSRGGLLAFLAALLCLIGVRIWSTSSTARRRLVAGLLGAALVAGAASFSGLGGSLLASDRYGTLFSSAGLSQIDQLQTRQQIWHMALSMLNARPLTGFGLDSVLLATGGIYPAHETFLEIGAGMGYPGLAAFLVLIVMGFMSLIPILRRGDGTAKALSGLGLAVLTSYVVTGLSETIYGHPFVPEAVWLIVALPIALACRRAREAEHPEGIVHWVSWKKEAFAPAPTATIAQMD
ncbi:MAG TPA: O-antigen ligase family protein [Chloroflexota bacterium]|nr:O-antigen ligase family protein [Chloroflexota bacterium]